MHGAIRYLRAAPGPAHPVTGLPGSGGQRSGGQRAGPTAGEPGGRDPFGDPILGRPPVPWWDPGSDSSVSPETDQVLVAGVRVARGSRVRMRPGSRRADAQDLFLVGRTATVEAVLHDVDGQVTWR
jgi:hypothetical protein